MTLSALEAAPTAAVFRHAWRQLIFAASTFVFQAGLLAALAVCVFVVGALYETDYAALDLVWTFWPWVALFLVPAFAMRSFPTEGGNRELELISTLPVSDAEVVVGTWLAGSALLLATLAFTAPIPLTIAYLGSPDWGAMGAGYVGAGILLVTSYAVALAAAALTRDQTSAYVCGVAALMCATLAGSATATRVLSPALADALGHLSPKHGLDVLAAGRIDLSAILDATLIISLALFAATSALTARRGPTTTNSSLAMAAAKAALALIGATALASVWSTFDIALDVTDQRLTTLHPATITAARALPPGTTLDFHWSESEPGVPARIRAHAHQIERMLAALARRSQGRLTLTTHDPAPDTEADWAARATGIRRVAMSSGDSFILGLAIRAGDRQHTFAALDVDRAQSFEYDLALALTKLGQVRVPKLGLISALFTPANATAPREGLSVLDRLKQTADVAIIPYFADGLPDDLDVVIVLGGSLLKPSMLADLDRHARRGRGLIVCLDPVMRFHPSSDAVVPVVTGRGETIADVLAGYGVRFDARVSGDSMLAATVSAEDGQKSSYPFWLRLPRSQIAATHPATAGLRELLFVEPGSLSLDPASTAIALVTTSSASGSLPASAFKGAAPATLASQFVTDGMVRTLAAFVPGPLSGGAAPAAVFVVADVDWLFDPAAVEGADGPAPRPLNDNHAFLANMIDVAGRDLRLLDIRTRGSADRRFTRIDQMLTAARARYRADESEAMARIAKIEDTVAEIVKIAKVQSPADLPANIRTEIERLNVGLLPVRRRLRELRASMRQEVEALGRTLTIANVVAGPVLTLLFATLIFARRRVRQRPAP